MEILDDTISIDENGLYEDRLHIYAVFYSRKVKAFKMGTYRRYYPL